MRQNTRKLTYSAVATAIAVAFMYLSHFLRLQTAPLFISALCFYIAFSKGNIVYGFLSIIASLLLLFVTLGITGTFLMAAIVFAPYSVLTFFLGKLSYRKPLSAVLRILILAAFSNLVLWPIYALNNYLFFDLTQVVEKLGGYWVLALAVSAAFIVIDFVFSQLCLYVTKAIK